jgi:hypothetical protein
LDGLRAVLEIIADEIKPKTRRRRLLVPTNTCDPRGAPVDSVRLFFWPGLHRVQ